MNIYEQKKVLKFVLIFVALLIIGVSLFYTNILVKKLSERELKLIDLYAKGLENIVNSENSDNISFLFNEIIEANNSVPVILANQEGEPIGHRNIEIPSQFKTKQEQNKYLKGLIEKMKLQHNPIEVKYGEDFKNYIYYQNSTLLSQLKYYPYIQIAIISAFVMLGYLAFNYLRKSEQNKVWVGMAKETAHQLGTPISSLMAWVEFLKTTEGAHSEHVTEMEKDISRLNMITERFSNIGSVPVLKSDDLVKSTRSVIDYLRKRISSKVALNITNSDEEIMAKFNAPLYEWVIENIVKNAVDAMNGEGKVDVTVSQTSLNEVTVDIKDSGKGIPKSNWNKVFMPGFTTKQRGWGLGLALAKRIIEEYHSGKLMVSWSEPNEGTNFRIVLKN
jgi:two-component system, sporulation sensor kinase E